MLLSVASAPGFPEYEWRELKPCSDKVTRVLAVLMAEEKTAILTKMVLWLQEQQNSLGEGFTVNYKGEDYMFFPTFVDRYIFFRKFSLLNMFFLKQRQEDGQNPQVREYTL